MTTKTRLLLTDLLTKLANPGYGLTAVDAGLLPVDYATCDLTNALKEVEAMPCNDGTAPAVPVTIKPEQLTTLLMLTRHSVRVYDLSPNDRVKIKEAEEALLEIQIKMDTYDPPPVKFHGAIDNGPVKGAPSLLGQIDDDKPMPKTYRLLTPDDIRPGMMFRHRGWKVGHCIYTRVSDYGIYLGGFSARNDEQIPWDKLAEHWVCCIPQPHLVDEWLPCVVFNPVANLPDSANV